MVLRFLFTFMLFTTQLASAAAIEVRVLDHHQSQYNNHATQILRHALSYNENKYEISLYSVEGDLARELLALEKGKLTVAWKTTSRDSEERFLPIRIPVFAGLLAYRILLIRPEMQKAFNQVETLAQLKEFSFGHGEHWAETELFMDNGLKVVTSPFYYRLFDMLDHGRFDAFPRGITEPWSELRAYTHLNLAVEKKLLIKYRQPVYFFVRKDDQDLAKDIAYGMNKAFDDGSMKSILLSDPDLVKGLTSLDLDNRRVFQLQNPSLPKKTPLNVEKYWITPKMLMSKTDAKPQQSK